MIAVAPVSILEWWDSQLYRCPWCGRLRLDARLMRRQHRCGAHTCPSTGPTGEHCERVTLHGGVHDDGDGVTW